MSPSQLIGKIIDHFVEFQQKGSPHVCFGLRVHPKIDGNTDEEVVEFIDKYLTCALPSLTPDKSFHFHLFTSK